MIDWKIGIFILQIILICSNIITFMILKFNDLKHLSADVKGITKEMKEFKTEFKKVSDKVIAIDVRCEERH